mgnify:CR=1 FL=1
MCKCKVIAVTNQKGGVGKTTTTENVAIGLSLQGFDVLIVDFDPQGDLTSCLGWKNNDALEHSVSSMLDDYINDNDIDYDSLILHHEEDVDLIPANIELADFEMRLVSVINREQTLSNCIEPLRDKYDYIFIDCPPSLGLLTTNALTASDSVMIPVQCEYYSLEGVTQLLNTILLTQSKINPKLDIEGVLLTMLDGRTLVGLEVVEDVRKFFKEKVFNTIIPRLVRLVEAPSHGKPILEYDPKCRGALAYINLAKEVIERNGKQEESTREGARTTI